MVKQHSLAATVARKFSSFRSFPLLDQLLMPVVFALLGMARVTILIAPLRYYARFLGQYRQTEIYTPVLTSHQIQRARRLGRIVRATAKVTPWESLCLVQALVASVLLRMVRIPYILHFGLAKNLDPTRPDPMNAHAWVTAGSVSVTGGQGLFHFTVVGSYVSPLLTKSIIYE